MIALDASALLACLFGEVGGDRVEAVLEDCCLSTVNLSEVLGRFTRDGHDAVVVMERLLASGLAVVPFDARQAALAASLIPETRLLGLSLGDRACLALARERGIPAMTADRAWVPLEGRFSLILIR